MEKCIFYIKKGENWQEKVKERNIRTLIWMNSGCTDLFSFLKQQFNPGKYKSVMGFQQHNSRLIKHSTSQR